METWARERVREETVSDLTQKAATQISFFHRVICGAIVEGCIWIRACLSLSCFSPLGAYSEGANFYLGDYSWLSWKLLGGTQFSIMTPLQDHKQEEERVGLNKRLAN